jgi:serine/threonine protein kinase
LYADVPIGGQVTIPEASAYFIFEYIEGNTLQEIIDANKPVSLSKITNWINKIKECIEFLGGCGVVHRDIKPPNIYITAKDGALLFDFDMACQVDCTECEFRGTKKYATPTAKSLVSPGGFSSGFTSASPCVSRYRYTTGYDMYSLGVMIQEDLIKLVSTPDDIENLKRLGAELTEKHKQAGGGGTKYALINRRMSKGGGCGCGLNKMFTPFNI